MTDNVSLVTDALKYYDKNSETYKDFFKDVRYIKFIAASSDMTHNMIIMANKDKKIIIRSKYEVIGTFNSDSATWIWAWSMPRFNKNTTYIARKIFNYGAELDPQFRFLKTELITSRFRIGDPVQLDMHVAIASYLSKKPLTYKYINPYNVSDYDAEGYVDVTLKGDNYVAYYMFLLDYDNKIESNK